MMTDPGAQKFWLQTLSTANDFTRWVIAEISPWLGQRVLEVGCGIGTYSLEIAADTRKVVCVELEEAFVEEFIRRVGNRPNVQVICKDATLLDEWTPNLEGFDTILLLDVLEHIENDVGMLANLAARLMPGGYMIVKVPAMPSIYSAMDVAIGHRRRYDTDSLRGVLLRSGLEIVQIWSFNALAVLGWWWNGRVLGRVSPPREQIARFNRLVPAIRAFDRFGRLFCGISIIAIARRPIGAA
jgi:SAM-dependent methyltransferase